MVFGLSGWKTCWVSLLVQRYLSLCGLKLAEFVLISVCHIFDCVDVTFETIANK